MGNPVLDACAAERSDFGFVSLESLFRAAAQLAPTTEVEEKACALARLFNTPLSSRTRMLDAIRNGSESAANTRAWMDAMGIVPAPCAEISQRVAETLEARLLRDPAGYLEQSDYPYPCLTEGKAWAFPTGWIANLLKTSEARWAQFCAQRRSDTAILVGNGPSLRNTDLGLLGGQDVFISNYATRHPRLAEVARGVAASNYYVADQAPEAFAVPGLVRFLPAWLSHVIEDSDQTIWVHALGGPLFFADTLPTRKIAWHATVTYLWMQILYHAGYRKLLLIGVDNIYAQPKDAREGALLHQAADDENHFDPSYFRGKTWQAADTRHMAKTYELAKSVYAADGREIINCTVGGAVEVFERSTLEKEIRHRNT